MTDARQPTGVVTFLFTDVEGSTAKWEADPDVMSVSLRVHDDILRDEISGHNGYVFTTAGDAFCAAFQRATDAVVAAAAIQDRLAAADWPSAPLRVRMGLHMGEAEERDGDYFGPVLNLGARVQSTGHGGQVVMTAAVREAASVDGLELGTHRLKDVGAPVVLWQLGSGDHLPLRTAVNPSNLPVPATRLFGRADEVRNVRVLLRDSRLVTLAAVGGTGKTRLAIEVAEQELDNWRDGVWFADLTQANDNGQVAVVVARALGLELRSGAAEVEVAAYLAGRTILLVLDNCEHVADGSADLVSAILGAGGRSAVLATSREWLDVDGERVVQVRSLDAGTADSPAVRLFVDRASAVEPSFRLDAATTSVVTELCDRLDGIPLAIELAASRVPVMSPAVLLEGLDDRFRLLSGGRRRQRVRTLEATIDWSYDLLDAEDQRVFRHLGVFAGSFDLRAVAAVCVLSRAEAVDAVESLYSRSLVARSDDWPDRFRLLETLKAYAEDRLVDAGEAAEARAGHVDHFLAEARVEEWIWLGDALKAGVLMPDTANLMLCLDELESAERWGDLTDLLNGVLLLLLDNETYRDSVARCRDKVDDPDRQDHLICMQALISNWESDWVSYIERCQELSASPDLARASYGIIGLALVTGRTDPEQAQHYIDRFVAMSPPDPNDGRILMESSERAFLAGQRFDMDGAREWALRGLQVASGVAWGSASVPHLEALRGVAAWTRGDLADLDGGVDRIDRVFAPIGVRDFLSDYLRRFLATTAAVARGATQETTALVRAFAVDAATGRIKLAASDALTFLAALTEAEGDRERAGKLVMATTVGRSTAGIAAILHMANQTGVRDALDRQYLERYLDTEWLVSAADAPLQTELNRRGWD